MHSTRRSFAILVLSVATPLAAQTTWTGAVSTNWDDNANWTAGIPDQNTPAVISPATRQPVLAGFAECRHLTINAGTALTVNASATLGVFGDASFAASVLGTGTIKWYGAPGNPTPTPAQIAFTNQASIPNARVDDGFDATFTDLSALSLRATSLSGVFPGPHIVLHGQTHLASAAFTNLPQGQVDCDASGGLFVTGVLDLEWNMALPGTLAVTHLNMWSTSSVTPSSGVIRIPTTQTLSLESYANNSTSLTVDVAAGATFHFRGSTHASANHLDFVQAAGAIQIISNTDDVIRVDHVDGDMVLGGSGTFFPSPYDDPILTSLTPGQPVVVGAGGSLTYGIPALGTSFLLNLHVRGTLQVDGRLTIGAVNGAFRFPNTLRLEDVSPTDLAHLVIGASGTLELRGGSTGNPSILEGDGNHHATVEVHGTIAASWAAFRGLGPGGLQLLAGSTVAAAPQDLDNCVFDDGAPAAGSTLLTMARDAATRLDSCTFDASNSTATYAIRATSPHAVDVRNYSGTLGDEGHENDPHGAISWTDGVSFLGTATPGCRGLAEQRVNSEPHIGNGAFALTCANAVPGGPALQILGIAGLQTPTPVLGTGLWVDPGQPLVSPLVFAGAGGTLSFPRPLPNNAGLIGVALCAQALILEAPACMPLGLSASTAIRFTILP